MAKPDFSKIPASKEASPRQISAIANRFAKLTNPEDSWMLTKKYTAVLYRFQKESGKNLTHGDIQKFFKVSKVPKNFSDLLSTAEETPKESPKKAPTKTSKTPPKVSEASELKALKKQVADLTAAVQLLLKNS